MEHELENTVALLAAQKIDICNRSWLKKTKLKLDLNLKGAWQWGKNIALN